MCLGFYMLGCRPPAKQSLCPQGWRASGCTGHLFSCSISVRLQDWWGKRLWVVEQFAQEDKGRKCLGWDLNSLPARLIPWVPLGKIWLGNMVTATHFLRGCFSSLDQGKTGSYVLEYVKECTWVRTPPNNLRGDFQPGLPKGSRGRGDKGIGNC